MKKQTIRLFTAFLALIVIFVMILLFCSNSIRVRHSLSRFHRIIESDIEDVELEIYYFSPLACTLYPMSEERLMNAGERRVLICGELKEFEKQLLNFSRGTHRAVRDNYPDYRIMLKFTKDASPLLTIHVNHYLDGVYINGVPVEYDESIDHLLCCIFKEYEAFSDFEQCRNKLSVFPSE